MSTTAPTIAPELADAEALFRAYYSYLRALARNRMHVAAPADRAFGVDDLTQEIAAAVYRGRHYFRPERGRLTGWLARMASRTAYAVHRSTAAAKRPKPERAGVLADLPDPAAGAPEPVGDVWQAVARFLTPVELHALTLRFVEGLDQKEIGARLGCHQTRAGAAIERALQTLHRRRFDLLRALGRV